MKKYPEGTKARFMFKSIIAKSRYKNMNPTNSRIVDIVGSHPFIAVMNDNEEWRVFDDKGKIIELRFGYISNSDAEMDCFNMTVIEEKFPEIKKETALVINDLRVTKDNYKEVVKFINDSFGE